jgi:hypothetical protein
VKVKATFLSIFFLMLTMFPCVDEETVDICAAELHYHMQGSQERSDTDLCSPFCLCQCCNTSITTNHAFNNPLLSRNHLLHQTLYKDDLGRDIPDSLFQPPQA